MIVLVYVSTLCCLLVNENLNFDGDLVCFPLQYIIVGRLGFIKSNIKLNIVTAWKPVSNFILASGFYASMKIAFLQIFLKGTLSTFLVSLKCLLKVFQLNSAKEHFVLPYLHSLLMMTTQQDDIHRDT